MSLSRLRPAFLSLLVGLALSGAGVARAEPPTGTPPIEKILATIRAKLASALSALARYQRDYVADVFARADEFQRRNRGSSAFDLREAEALAEELAAIAERMSSEPALRSRAYLALAAMEGKIAEKLGKVRGMGRAKSAFRALEDALAVDPDSADAAYSYCVTILEFWNQDRASRFLIESALGIDLGTEARRARAALERTRQTSGSCYRELGPHAE